MIAATMSTIPARRSEFISLVHRILREQTVPVDALYVCLHGYETIDPSLPCEPRLRYRLGKAEEGPWVRYTIAEHLADDDILVTLDDDTIYPADYIERGLADLARMRGNSVVCYGGLRWSPFAHEFRYYGHERVLIRPSTELRRDFRVAILQGICSFMRAQDVKHAVQLTLPGFNTNDDLMISYHLWQTGRKIYCCPKDENWIRQTEQASASHALAVRDKSARSETFYRMVYELGFDPTADWMEEFHSVERHVVVLSNTIPSIQDSDLHSKLVQGWDRDTMVHVVAQVRHSQLSEVPPPGNTPYVVHPSPVPDEGGRMQRVPLVRKWRNWRIQRAARLTLAQRLTAILDKLPHAKVVDLRNGTA